MLRLVVGVTGASGAVYAVRFLRAIAPKCERIDVILSGNGQAVAATELGLRLTRPLRSIDYLGEEHGCIRFQDKNDFYTPPASGSYVHQGMVIIPCSVGTLGRIASGVSDDLMCRAADVCLKEKRPLILVVRETPFNLIHLRNMTTLAESGATILPAVPAFYHNPQTVEDLVDTVVARVIQNLGVEQSIVGAWQEDST